MQACARRARWSGLVSLVRWKMVAWFWGSGLDSAIIKVIDASVVGGLIDDQEAGGDHDRNRKFWQSIQVAHCII